MNKFWHSFDFRIQFHVQGRCNGVVCSYSGKVGLIFNFLNSNHRLCTHFSQWIHQNSQSTQKFRPFSIIWSKIQKLHTMLQLMHKSWFHIRKLSRLRIEETPKSQETTAESVRKWANFSNWMEFDQAAMDENRLSYKILLGIEIISPN